MALQPPCDGLPGSEWSMVRDVIDFIHRRNKAHFYQMTGHLVVLKYSCPLRDYQKHHFSAKQLAQVNVKDMVKERMRDLGITDYFFPKEDIQNYYDGLDRVYEAIIIQKGEIGINIYK
jgi:hypothetical protein